MTPQKIIDILESNGGKMRRYDFVQAVPDDMFTDCIPALLRSLGIITECENYVYLQKRC